MFRLSWKHTDLMERELKKRNVTLLVAVSSSQADPAGGICGYIIITFTSLNAHVAKVAVQEDKRRMGVARGLLTVRDVGICSTVLVLGNIPGG